MPKRRTYRGRRVLRRAYVKRRLAFRRFRRKRRTWRRPGRVITGMPKKVIIRHKYAEEFDLTATAAATGLYFFSCNSLNDPNRSAGGHQPMLYDQFAALYNNYCVIRARMKVTFFANGANELVVGTTITQTPTPTYMSNIGEAQENTTTQFRSIAQTVTDRPCVMWRSNVPSRFIGKPMFNEDLIATIGSNPDDECYFCIWVANADGANGVSAVQCNVVLWYTAMWMQPKTVIQS